MNAPSNPTVSQTRSQGSFSTAIVFSGGPVTQASQWLSGVTMLVRWLFPWLQNSLSGGPFPATERQVALFFPDFRPAFVRWLYDLSMASGNAPHGKMVQQAREPTGLGVISKATKDVPAQCFLAVTGFWARNAPLSSRSECEGAVGPSCSQRAHFQCSRIAHSETCEKKAKTKARGQSRGESPKGNHQFPKIGDHQERRHTHKWRKTD